MFSSLTPFFFSVVTVPERRASIILAFQRAWMMPIRRPEPGRRVWLGFALGGCWDDGLAYRRKSWPRRDLLLLTWLYASLRMAGRAVEKPENSAMVTCCAIPDLEKMTSWQATAVIGSLSIVGFGMTKTACCKGQPLRNEQTCDA